MESRRNGKQARSLTGFATLGERSSRLAVSVMRKGTLAPQWLRFSQDMQEKYAARGIGLASSNKDMRSRIAQPGWSSDLLLDMQVVPLWRWIAHLLPHLTADSHTEAADTGAGRLSAPPQVRPFDSPTLQEGIPRSDRRDVIGAHPPGEMPERDHVFDSQIVSLAPAGSQSAQTPPEVREIDTILERSSYSTLDTRSRELLARILKIRLPTVKIYANRDVDAVVQRFDADALTYQDNILFSAGKFDPRSRVGIALLGHELTHAAIGRLRQEGRLAYGTLATPEAEEREALANEMRVLHNLTFPQVHGGRQEASGFPRMRAPLGNNRRQQTRGETPKPALTSRDLTLPPEMDAAPGASPELSTQQLDMIKEEVYQDLMNRIRIEFERGG